MEKSGSIAIWRFPEIVVAPGLIHFNIGFSIINHSFGGTPISGNPHIYDFFGLPLIAGAISGPGQHWRFAHHLHWPWASPSVLPHLSPSASRKTGTRPAGSWSTWSTQAWAFQTWPRYFGFGWQMLMNVDDTMAILTIWHGQNMRLSRCGTIPFPDMGRCQIVGPSPGESGIYPDSTFRSEANCNAWNGDCELLWNAKMLRT